jgi:hypothetical protein
MMKRLIAIALVALPLAAAAANLVAQYKLPDGTTVCVYDDGSSLRTSFNNCPSIK